MFSNQGNIHAFINMAKVQAALSFSGLASITTQNEDQRNDYYL